MNIINAFTVDVEDYFHVSAFSDRIPTSDWEAYESRVVQNTIRIINLLARSDIRATFFILGWVAEKFPELVREIAARGHEIGTHSYWHQLVYQQTPVQFREDLRRSLDALNQITGLPILSYRAPSFSITKRSQWALEILAEEGIEMDSSIFPTVHDNYGVPDAETAPHVISLTNGRCQLKEFPPSVHQNRLMNLPISGGGYFRLYPFPLSRHLLRQVNHKQQSPFMFYIHPWEVDPDQPRIPAKLKSRFRHYQNLRTTEKKLEKLLQSFRFGTMSEAYDSYSAPLKTIELQIESESNVLSVRS